MHCKRNVKVFSEYGTKPTALFSTQLSQLVRPPSITVVTNQSNLPAYINNDFDLLRLLTLSENVTETVVIVM